MGNMLHRVELNPVAAARLAAKGSWLLVPPSAQAVGQKRFAYRSVPAKTSGSLFCSEESGAFAQLYFRKCPERKGGPTKTLLQGCCQGSVHCACETLRHSLYEKPVSQVSGGPRLDTSSSFWLRKACEKSKCTGTSWSWVKIQTQPSIMVVQDMVSPMCI